MPDWNDRKSYLILLSDHSHTPQKFLLLHSQHDLQRATTSQYSSSEFIHWRSHTQHHKATDVISFKTVLAFKNLVKTLNKTFQKKRSIRDYNSLPSCDGYKV